MEVRTGPLYSVQLTGCEEEWRSVQALCTVYNSPDVKRNGGLYSVQLTGCEEEWRSVQAVLLVDGRALAGLVGRAVAVRVVVHVGAARAPPAAPEEALAPRPVGQRARAHHQHACHAQTEEARYTAHIAGFVGRH